MGDYSNRAIMPLSTSWLMLTYGTGERDGTALLSIPSGNSIEVTPGLLRDMADLIENKHKRALRAMVDMVTQHSIERMGVYHG